MDHHHPQRLMTQREIYSRNHRRMQFLKDNIISIFYHLGKVNKIVNNLSCELLNLGSLNIVRPLKLEFMVLTWLKSCYIVFW